MFKSIKIAAATLAAVAAIAASPLAALVTYAFALPEESYTQVPGTMLYVSPEAAPLQAAQIEEYQALPQAVLAMLAEKDCRIYAETTAEKGDYSYITGSSAAVGVYSTGRIRYSSADHRQIVGIITPNSIEFLADEDIHQNGLVMIHEIGHFVDCNAYGGWAQNAMHYVASATPTWQAIYAQDAAAIGTLSRIAAANIYNNRETFAMAFAHYILTPDALRAASPAAYAYMEEVVASLE